MSNKLKNGSAYGTAASDTDFRKNWDLDEYAAKAKAREATEKEEAKARYEAKLAGKKYHKPATGNEVLTSARRIALDVSAMVGKTTLVPAGAGVGKRGKGAGFYCEACDLTFKDNKSLVDHMNTMQHLMATGQTAEVKRATVKEVRGRIRYWVEKKGELKKEQALSLGSRLKIREEERDKAAAERRRRRHEEAEKRKMAREKAEEEARKVDYGEDVRIEGEHEEEDMMTAMGISGFGSSKK